MSDTKPRKSKDEYTLGEIWDEVSYPLRCFNDILHEKNCDDLDEISLSKVGTVLEVLIKDAGEGLIRAAMRDHLIE